MADVKPAEKSINVSDLFSIDGKVAVVTGGSRGIGLMIAEGFVKAGAKVYISSRKEQVCESVAKRLSEFGTCVSMPSNLATEAGCVALAKAIGKREEKLDILVNNAGANWGESLSTFPASAWDKVLGLNVKSPFMLTRDLVPLLTIAGSPGNPSRVINIGSIDGIKTPRFETYAYSASKSAVHQLTRHLASQLGPNITVNAVAPGPFESKMSAYMLDNFREGIVGTCPMNRIGEPEDMAGIAIFLASRAASYITGAVICVDGGISIR